MDENNNLMRNLGKEPPQRNKCATNENVRHYKAGKTNMSTQISTKFDDPSHSVNLKDFHDCYGSKIDADFQLHNSYQNDNTSDHKRDFLLHHERNFGSVEEKSFIDEVLSQASDATGMSFKLEDNINTELTETHSVNDKNEFIFGSDTQLFTVNRDNIVDSVNQRLSSKSKEKSISTPSRAKKTKPPPLILYDESDYVVVPDFEERQQELVKETCLVDPLSPETQKREVIGCLRTIRGKIFYKHTLTTLHLL